MLKYEAAKYETFGSKLDHKSNEHKNFLLNTNPKKVSYFSMWLWNLENNFQNATI